MASFKKKHFGTIKYIATYLFQVAVVCLFAFVFVWYFGQRVSIVGNSMAPVVKNQDVVLINRIVYDVRLPRHGEIVAFLPNGNPNAHMYVKRIIGVPGDTLQIVDGKLYRNQKELVLKRGRAKIDNVGLLKEPITLSSDEYFVLGDQLEYSDDSRNANIGIVRKEFIFGKVWLRLFPFSRFQKI